MAAKFVVGETVFPSVLVTKVVPGTDGLEAEGQLSNGCAVRLIEADVSPPLEDDGPPVSFSAPRRPRF